MHLISSSHHINCLHIITHVVGGDGGSVNVGCHPLTRMEGSNVKLDETVQKTQTEHRKRVLAPATPSPSEFEGWGQSRP